MEVITQLIKTGLINETIVDGVPHFSSKKRNKKTPTSYRDKWVPDKDVIDQINEYGIPEDFANLQIDDFKKLNQERNEKDINWGVKFLRFVIKKWRHKEVEDNKKMKTKPIDKNWVPDMDAKEILINSGINEDFIDKEVPEFVLYWTERKEESDIWNSKFIAHIRRQWGRFKEIKENDNLPSVMTSDWSPNSDFFDVLEMTDIPKEFAENAKLEFVMYWKESGQALNSWNSKFLQHVKYKWERANKDSIPQLSKQIDKRIESSWEIQDNISAKPSKKLDAETLQENFKKLKENSPSYLQIVGDDLVVTNTKLIKKAYKKNAINSILIKPNQIGTISETSNALKLSNELNLMSILSARSGETEDNFISDLSVGWKMKQLKVGSFSRSERMSKWNQCLRIGEKFKDKYAMHKIWNF